MGWLRKRLTTTGVAAIAVPVLWNLGLPAEITNALINLTMVYIGGQSASDVAAYFRTTGER